MKCNTACQLMSFLLLSTFSVPGYAITTANLAGPTYLFKSQVGKPRIYHGFDTAFMTANPNLGSTFLNGNVPSTTIISDPTPLGTPPSAGNGITSNKYPYPLSGTGAQVSPYSMTGGRLKHIADMGYTHIQISPPCLIVPSTAQTIIQGYTTTYSPNSYTITTTVSPATISTTTTYNNGAQNVQGTYTPPVPSTQTVQLPNVTVPDTVLRHDFWYLSYQPYVCNLSYAPSTPGAKSYYQTELDQIFGTNADGTSKKPISNYGVQVTNSSGQTAVVGFRIGNDRYGTLTDLVTLIQNAKKYNLGVIADVSFHQIGWQSSTFTGGNLMSDGTEFPFYAVTCNASTPGSIAVQSTGQIAAANLDTTVLLNAATFGSTSTVPGAGANATTYSGSATNFIIPNKTNGSAWNFGPPLDPSQPGVQKMIAGYLQSLYDIGIVGLRIDDLIDIVGEVGATGLSTILGTIPPSGTSSPCLNFQFGYGEVYKFNLSDMRAYGPVMPVEDFPLQQQLSNGFGNVNNVYNLLSAPSIANTPALTFSCNHDMYPRVGGGNSGLMGQLPFVSVGTVNNLVPNPTLSQLALAYLCAKRDGSPQILRFDDELDNPANPNCPSVLGKTIVQRGLAFRVLMEQFHAPHEYVAALNNNNTLLIARQFGFALINRGTSDYTLGQFQTDINALNNGGMLSYYIPSGTYYEAMGLTSISPTPQLLSSPTIPATPVTILNPTQNRSDANASTSSTFAVNWSGTSPSLAITGPSAACPNLNVKFFVLKTPSKQQSSCDVTFACPSTASQQTAIAGNHPLLGNWGIRPDLLNLMMQV